MLCSNAVFDMPGLMARARLTDGVLVSSYEWVLLASAMWCVQRMPCPSMCC